MMMFPWEWNPRVGMQSWILKTDVFQEAIDVDRSSFYHYLKVNTNIAYIDLTAEVIR